MMCFDEWSSSILSNCGHYYSTPAPGRYHETGDFKIDRRHGVDMARLSCRITRLDHTKKAISRDSNAFIFLLFQTSGETRVIHNGRREVLSPGEALLLDSTRTSEMIYNSTAASFVSVHLPRALYLARNSRDLLLGHKIDARHPLQASLQAMVQQDTPDGHREMSPEFLFDFIALMFRRDVSGLDATTFRSRASRFEFVGETMDRHLAEPEFSIDRLAALVNMSRRQLQRDFQNNGTTFSRYLNDKRVNLVAAHLRRAGQSGARPVISNLAFGAGFNDLSYFNREFRKRLGLSPVGYLAECDHKANRTAAKI